MDVGVVQSRTMMPGRNNLKLTKPASTVRTSAQMSDSRVPPFLQQKFNSSISHTCSFKRNDVRVSENSGTPKSSHFNRVFHYFHHPIWGKNPYFWNSTHVFPPSSPPTSHLLATFLTSQRLFCGWPTAAQKNMVLLSSFFLTQNTTRFLRI